MSIKLLSKKSLEKLNKADPSQRDYTTDKYYKPILRNLYLKKIKIALELLGQQKYEKMLDVGFGGGVITPELSGRCKQYFGTDIHKNIGLVGEILKDEGLENIDLQYAKTDLPFEDNTFDCVWCMSVLEFVTESEKMIREIKRVAKNGAKIILGFPITNKITDLAYKLISFESDEIHQNDHKVLTEQINKYLEIRKIKHFPVCLPLDYSLFVILEATQND